MHGCCVAAPPHVICRPRGRQRATEGGRAQVTVVLRNVFHPSEFEAEPALHAELQADMLKECTKLGAVDKARRTRCRRPACCGHCRRVADTGCDAWSLEPRWPCLDAKLKC